MASHSPKPSSSSESANVASDILSREVRSFCDVNYVSDGSGITFQDESFVSQFKADSVLPPVVSYGQFIDPCTSSSTYAQILRAHDPVSLHPSTPPPQSELLPNLDAPPTESHHQSQEPEDTVAISIDQLNLHHVSIVHPGLPNLGPIILDRNSLAALLASSRDGTFTFDVAQPQRELTGQVEEADGALGLLSPMLSQKDIFSAPSTSTSSAPFNHKQMLAQKYAAEMLGGSAPGPSSGSAPPSLLANRSSYSEGASLLDSDAIAVYEDVASSLPSTSVSQCLSVYSMERGVSLVSSSRDSPDIHESVDFEPSHPSSHHSVQNFVSSSVDLVHSHRLDHGMHCDVDSTVGPKLHPGDENIVDSSDGYNDHLGSPEDVLHTTTGGDYGCHLSDLNACDDATTSEAVTSVLGAGSPLGANEAMSSTSQFSQNPMDDLQTVSSATHPDSTHSPGAGEEDSSPGYTLPHSSLHDPDLMQAEYSRPRRDGRNRHWCDDCGVFYDKECIQHRIQLIFDKPVLSRAWASLPAQYLYVNKIAHDENGDAVYGVFAKKTIPKRTQFGPVEGLLVKKEDLTNSSFLFVLDQGEEEGGPLYMDTSDEGMSNWMRFVRPAGTHKEQNLVLVQHGRSLYFNTTRTISARAELRVWYSGAYAEKWRLPLLEIDEEGRRALDEQENAWPCFECNQRFSTSEDLQKHLNQHDEENEVSGNLRQRAKLRPKYTKKSHLAKLRMDGNGTSMESVLIRKIRGRAPKKYKLPNKEEFACDICFKVFPRNYSLQRHLIMHTGEKKYKCPICDIKFSHVYNRNRHVRRHKRGDNPSAPLPKPIKSLFKKKQGEEWVCTHCGLTFDNSSVLNLHALTHAAEEEFTFSSSPEERHPFLTDLVDDKQGLGEDPGVVKGEEEAEDNRCPECTEEFTTRRDLIEHASVHGKIGKQKCCRAASVNPLKPFKCNLCYKSFASDERLIRHYLVHGSDDSKPLQCDICYKRFLNNSALACHVKVHSEERKYYECPICKTEYDQIVALKEHVRIHCEDGVYSCPNCHKAFDEYNQVRKHIRAFHSERRYPCDKCDKIFPRPDKLKLHMLRHSDHREFLCANCGKQFKRKDKLKEHMKRMHAPDREAKVNAAKVCKPCGGSKKFVPKVSPTDYHRFIYKCHSCLLGFKRRGMLVNHLAKRHPDIRPESVPELNLPILKTTRDYYCQYCDKVYKSSSKRKAHILKNHPGSDLPMSNRRKGGVPDIPGMPNPTFSQTVGSITTHPHHCGWCHKQYASKAKLLQHQRKKHVEMLFDYATTPKVEPHCDQGGSPVPSQIVIESISTALSHEAAAAVLIDATKRKIHYVDKDSLVVSGGDGLPTADLLTQAMSELTQTCFEYRPGDFLGPRLSSSEGGVLSGASSPDNPGTPPHSILDGGQLDPLQLSQLLAQYQQTQQMSSQQLAVVVTSRPWPGQVQTSLANYPAR